MASGTDATQVVEWEDATGKKVKVPPNVRDALIAKFRGQPNLGPKAARILAFFHSAAYVCVGAQTPWIVECAKGVTV